MGSDYTPLGTSKLGDRRVRRNHRKIFVEMCILAVVRDFLVVEKNVNTSKVAAEAESEVRLEPCQRQY